MDASSKSTAREPHPGRHLTGLTLVWLWNPAETICRARYGKLNRLQNGPPNLTREPLALPAHEMSDSSFSVNVVRHLGIDGCSRVEIEASSGCSSHCGLPGKTFAVTPDARLGVPFRGHPPTNHL
jgi:hypothetical protein